jgi:hypothetical protein
MKVKYRRNHQILLLGSALPCMVLAPRWRPRRAYPHRLLFHDDMLILLSTGLSKLLGFKQLPIWRRCALVASSTCALTAPHGYHACTPACCLWSTLLRHRPATPWTPASLQLQFLTSNNVRKANYLLWNVRTLYSKSAIRREDRSI